VIVGHCTCGACRACTSRVTTDGTIADDLRASIQQRGFYAGVTFGDFVAACKAAGMTKHTELASIEYGIAQYGSGRIRVEQTDDGVEVREV